MAENDSLLEIYIFENLQLLEQLEGLLLEAEKSDRFTADQVGSIFRILHTVKGSSAMMNYDTLAKISHVIEDLFGYIRDNESMQYDHRTLCDLVISAQDFIRNDIEQLQNGNPVSQDSNGLYEEILSFYNQLKNDPTPAAHAIVLPSETIEDNPDTPPITGPKGTPAALTAPGEKKFYKAVVFFEKECKMENIRAFGILKSLEGMYTRIATIPEDVLKDQSDDMIVANGFSMYMESVVESDTLRSTIAGNILIESLTFEELPASEIASTPLNRRVQRDAPVQQDTSHAQKSNYMSVRLDKMDKLMDLVGEIVITEATVTKNPDIIGLTLESFSKSARQLRKLTDELQDTVMSIRMIPISATFHKLERIVRDMCKKTDKQADLIIIGEDTEMDKSVIDNLSDPLMHIIRNSMDHGIEPPAERESKGKPAVGKITLDARNTGGDVLISVSDDGRGLNRDVLIQKGIERGLVKKPPDEITDKEAYSLIFTAGFSTKEAVTEFSGRGVGMDVAMKNIQKIGGTITVDSTYGQGMTVQLRIPLTLAIIDGMQVSVGGNIYIMPLLLIQQSFKPEQNDVFNDPDGNEMIMIRQNCYRVVRLYEKMGIHTDVTNFQDGILIVVEADQETFCLFVDQLIGEQQTVIKPIPYFIDRNTTWLKGISGCTIMGDGSISLILDVNDLL